MALAATVIMSGALSLAETKKATKKKISLPKVKLASQNQYAIDEFCGLGFAQQQQPIEISADKDFTISGWAIDEKAKKISGGVIIDIDGKLFLANHGGSRPDIATGSNNPALKNAGYSAKIPISEIGKGQHTLTLKILTIDKKAYYSPEQKVVFEIK
jgi:hypothetical protein